MRPNKLLFTIFLLTIVFIGNAQETVEKIYNLTTKERILDFIKLKNDTGYLFIVRNELYPADSSWYNKLIHINNVGDTLETKIIGFHMHALTEYDSNYYYLVGCGGDCDAAIAKLNRDYEVVWDSIYTHHSNSPTRWCAYFKSVITTSTKKLVLGMFIDQFSDYPPYRGVYLIDSMGSMNTLIHSDSEYFYADFFELSNKNILIAGYTYDIFDQYYCNSYNEIFDSSGNDLFRNNFGEDFDAVKCSAMHDDTVYAFTYNYYGTNNLKILRIAPLNDSVLWEKEYFAGDSTLMYIDGISASYSSEDHIVMVGKKRFKEAYNQKHETFIFTINSKGDSISSYCLDTTGCFEPIKITTDENSFTVMGTWKYNNDSSDIYFFKAPLDSLYVSTPEVPKVVHGEQFKISPNPVVEQLKITFIRNSQQNRQIKVFRINGSLMTNISVPPGYNSVDVNVSDWQNGLYLFVLQKEDAIVASKKIVVNH